MVSLVSQRGPASWGPTQVTTRWHTSTDLELVDREKTIVLEMLPVIRVTRPSKIMIPDMVDDEKEAAQDPSRPFESMIPAWPA